MLPAPSTSIPDGYVPAWPAVPPPIWVTKIGTGSAASTGAGPAPTTAARKTDVTTVIRTSVLMPTPPPLGDRKRHTRDARDAHPTTYRGPGCRRDRARADRRRPGRARTRTARTHARSPRPRPGRGTGGRPRSANADPRGRPRTAP